MIIPHNTVIKNTNREIDTDVDLSGVSDSGLQEIIFACKDEIRKRHKEGFKKSVKETCDAIHKLYKEYPSTSFGFYVDNERWVELSDFIHEFLPERFDV